MENLNFRPKKTKDEFHNNYNLHDLAEIHGKNLLTQWGIDFKEFGKDNRYKRQWEKGKDKPDLIVKYNSLEALLDWKSKRQEKYYVNQRAIESYLQWGKSLKLPVFICFFVFDEENNLVEKRFADISKTRYKEKSLQAWDKNNVVEFEDELPELLKPNFVNALLNR